MTCVHSINVVLSLTDAGALWAAAADRAMAYPGMTMDDVVDTIGSRDDPMIEECLTMLVQPERFAGCRLESFTCTRTAAAATRGQGPGPYLPFPSRPPARAGVAAAVSRSLQTGG